MKPKRIQRKRTKGWKKPENTVYVGRPTKWGNPFKLCEKITGGQLANSFPEIKLDSHEKVVMAYNLWLDNTERGSEIKMLAKIKLKGKDLMCWCKEGEPCHGDVLLELSNI